MAKQIAITFDDAPLGDGSLYTGAERTNLLIEALESKGASATFFVTTKDLEEEGAAERLAAYNDAGFLIANHTNTHPAASSTPVNQFLAEIDLTTDLLDGYSNYRSWFRFPYLDEGKTANQHAALLDGLEARGIDNGYVTADTFDWYMQSQLDKAVYGDGVYDLDNLRDAYVDMIVSSANHYDAIGQTTFGRSPAQVLLLHENDLAAMFIDDAIDALRADGWEIISADDAYKDPIASMEPVTLEAVGTGRIAALAIDQGASYSIASHQSNTQTGIDALMTEHDVFVPGTTDPEPAPDIIGTAGNDSLHGTAGNDRFVSLQGEDTVRGSAGNDIIRLGDGYDQVDYNGTASDYTMVRNDDGSISVTKPGGGVDRLEGVDGFWFIGEEKWYLATDLAKLTTVSGITSGDDYILGTQGNDEIISLEGLDVVRGSAGSDVIRLGDGYDQVEYDGAAADYTMVMNSDGTITVTKPDGGVDTLEGVDGFWFIGEEKWYTATDLAQPTTITGITSGDDYIEGTSGNDTIVSLEGEDVVHGSAGNDVIMLGDGYDQIDYNGASADFAMVRNDDGTITVTKPDGGVDTLSGVDGFWFAGEEKWYSATDLARPTTVTGITPGNDYIVATDGNDTIVSLEGEDVVGGSAGNDMISLGDGYDQIDYTGSSADYAMSRNGDGTITVTKPDGGVDTLDGVDGFWFAGEEKWYSAEDLADAPAPGSTTGEVVVVGNEDIFIAETVASGSPVPDHMVSDVFSIFASNYTPDGPASSEPHQPEHVVLFGLEELA